MKKPAAKSGGGKKTSQDDDDVWSLASSTIEPLKRRKDRFHPAAERAKSATPPAEKPKQKAEIAAARATKQLSPNATAATAKISYEPKSQLAEFDRRSVRRIRSGQLEIEARIDLHGMRQNEAHDALRAFLLRAHDRGLRYVLVITGKGKAASDDDGHAGRERGVLKRNVPRWLAEPELARIVVSHTDAAIRHGGDGALYIHVRSKNRG